MSARHCPSLGQAKLWPGCVEYDGDVIVVRLHDCLFGLYNLDRVGYSDYESIARLRESVVREIDIALGDGNLIGGRIQIDKCLADILVNLAAQILHVRLALTESGGRLLAPEVVVLCVTETELGCSCLPDSGSGAARDGMMGISDGLCANRKVAERISPRARMRKLVHGGNCLEGMVG